MKNLVMFFAMVLCATMSYANHSIERKVILKKEQKADFHIHQEFVSDDGCKFTIDGTISTSWGTFTGFSGTISISGGGDCPDGSWNFGMIIYDDNTSNLSGDDFIVREVKSNSDVFRRLYNYIDSYNR